MSEAPNYPEVDDSKLKRGEDEESSSNGSNDDFVAGAHAEESGHAIQYRTCSWQKVSFIVYPRVLEANSLRLLLCCFPSTYVSQSCRFLGEPLFDICYNQP